MLEVLINTTTIVPVLHCSPPHNWDSRHRHSGIDTPRFPDNPRTPHCLHCNHIPCPPPRLPPGAKIVSARFFAVAKWLKCVNILAKAKAGKMGNIRSLAEVILF